MERLTTRWGITEQELNSHLLCWMGLALDMQGAISKLNEGKELTEMEKGSLPEGVDLLVKLRDYTSMYLTQKIHTGYDPIMPLLLEQIQEYYRSHKPSAGGMSSSSEGAWFANLFERGVIFLEQLINGNHKKDDIMLPHIITLFEVLHDSSVSYYDRVHPITGPRYV